MPTNQVRQWKNSDTEIFRRIDIDLMEKYICFSRIHMYEKTYVADFSEMDGISKIWYFNR